MTTSFKFPKQAVTLHWYHSKNGPEILREKQISGKGMNTLFIGTKGMLLTGFGGHKLLPEDKFADYKRPEQSIPKSPGFYNEWFASCKGGPAATCDFAYSGPLTETVLLGNVAYRAQGSFDWDAASLKASGNNTANKLIRTEFRKDWEV